MQHQSDRNIKMKIFALAFLALLIGVIFLLDDDYLNLENVLIWQDQMRALFNGSPILFGLIYFLVFTGITALCLPGASLMMLACAGCMNFGLCCLLSTAGSALGALITMLAARHALRSSVESKYGHQLDQINQGLNKHTISYLLSLRLAPVIPFVIFNLLAGLTQVKAKTFLWTSFVGMLPGTALYVYAGSQAGQANKLEDLLSLELFLAIAALAVFPWFFKWLFNPIRRAEQS